MSGGSQLDDIDRALIHELTLDGRATYARLAPAVGLSQAAVRTRVQRLLDERLVVVTGRVDPASFGMGVFTLAFVEVACELDKTASRLDDVDEAVFVVLGAGRFDLLVELRAPGDDAMLRALDRLRGLDEVRRLQTATVLRYEKQDWTGVGDRHAQPRPQPATPTALELDEIDRMLLRELIADGRATYAALAPVVGLSQAAVRDRVIDLLESRIICIEAHPAPEAVGIGGFAAIGIVADGPIASVTGALVQTPETALVARTIGRFDIVAEVWFDDGDHLGEVLDRIRGMEGAGTITTFPYLRISKEQFGPGQRS